jgi:GT2 family glycosyltransferase
MSVECPAESLGIVVIGRNEGDRLRRCLKSVSGGIGATVYVDSGSTDDSVVMSRAMGIHVHELDLSTPFTAARARNEGLRELRRLHPDLRFVFFVDGDCEVVPSWIGRGLAFIANRADVAVVCGFRRERYPEKTIYNLLCDLEWSDLPVGECKACGGDAIMRIEAFEQVGGYRAELICGEEPELCVRMRQAGWKIWRLAESMTIHDAGIDRFGQWWKRMVRGGYGFALGVALHGAPPERHWVREARSAWIWGLLIPLTFAVLTIAFGWWAVALLAVYPAQFLRLALQGKHASRANWVKAGSLVLGKFPEAIGQMKFRWDRIRCSYTHVIEYK